MKRLNALLAFSGLALVTGTVLAADRPPTATTVPIPRPSLPTPQPPSASGPLPDLVVRDLSVNERCQIVVTVANQGPGVLPDHAWPSSLLAIGLRGAVAGTVPLATVDPGHALRNPGGTARYLSGFTVPAAGAPGDAVVDYNNKVAEANEGNNTAARVLTCRAATPGTPPAGTTTVPAIPAPGMARMPGAPTTPGAASAVQSAVESTVPRLPGAAPSTASRPLPDLVIRDLRLNERCEVVVHVFNLGPGRVPDEVWTTRAPNSSSVYLTVDGRPWGGETIWKLDPRRALQSPGGHTIYASNYVVRGSATVQATVDHTNQVAEANEMNNRRVEMLTCRSAGAPATSGGALPDLKVVHTAALPAGALRPGQAFEFQVTVKNVGTGPAPGTVRPDGSVNRDGYMIDLTLNTVAIRDPVSPATFTPTFRDGMLLRGGRISRTGNLAPGEQKQYSARVVIPSDTPPAERYWVGVSVDPFNKVAEGPPTGESDNAVNHGITVR